MKDLKRWLLIQLSQAARAYRIGQRNKVPAAIEYHYAQFKAYEKTLWHIGATTEEIDITTGDQM